MRILRLLIIIFLNNNKNVFTGIGKFPEQYTIKINEDENATGIIKPPRRMPIALKKELKNTLDSLVQKEISKAVECPLKWASNLIIVEKPNKKLRFCFHPIELNKVIKGEYYLIPKFKEIRTRLANKGLFTVIDLKDGFLQVPLDDQSAVLCTFTTPFGYYVFTVTIWYFVFTWSFPEMMY